MDTLTIKYNTYAGALAPQPIRMTNVKWGGSPEKMEDGSEPQPWHCLPFVEGSTYGLEVIYPYETECHVIGQNGTVQFEWDFTKEPGGELTGGEFRAFSPVEASKYYLFNTRMDLQPPPGYVVRTEPHPRFFTDDTGTVPLAMIGHLQNEWYPRLVFIVFRAPRQGQRHIFRKGEPFAQVIFVPQRMKYDTVRMTFGEAKERRDLENAIETSRLDIAENVWRNPANFVFNNHYKVLARAFAKDGLAGVNKIAQLAVESRQDYLAKDKTIQESMALGAQRIQEQKYEQAEEIFEQILERDPNNAAAFSALGVSYATGGNVAKALQSMAKAVELQPNSANFHMNLGELLRRQGRLIEAESSFRSASFITPNDPEVLSVLGLTVAQQGRDDEALEIFKLAIATGSPTPPAYYGMGMILAGKGRHTEARAGYEAALAIAPGFHPARQALEKLNTTEFSG